MNIYKVTNKLSGRAYIGQTVRPVAERWKRHLYAAERGSKKAAIHAAIRKYGAHSFTVEVLSTCSDREQLDDAESYFIDLMQTLSPDGYNLRTGGHRYKYTAEVREKMAAAKRGKPHRHSPEAIAKLRASHKGKVISQAQREKARANQLGKRLSAETRARIKAALAVVKRRNVIDLDTGEVFPSLRSAATYAGLRYDTLKAQLNGQNPNRTSLRYKDGDA